MNTLLYIGLGFITLGFFISCGIRNNDSTLRQKTMGTRGEKKMEGIELMIAIIGAVVILTFYT
jgi:hypothetical protein